MLPSRRYVLAVNKHKISHSCITYCRRYGLLYKYHVMLVAESHPHGQPFLTLVEAPPPRQTNE